MPSNTEYMDLPDDEPRTGGRDLVPDGKYTARVIEMETITANTGTPGMKVKLKIIGGDHDGSEIENAYWLTPAAMGIFQGFLKSCGVTYKGKGVNVMNAKGKTIRVKVRIRKSDQGNDFSEVHWCEALEGNQPEMPTAPPDNQEPPPEKSGKRW